MSTEIFTSYSQAFELMQKATQLNEPFKLVHRKIDGSIKVIPKTLLRKQTDSRIDSQGSYKANYIDVTSDNYGSCYIPLIMSVNDKEIILS